MNAQVQNRCDVIVTILPENILPGQGPYDAGICQKVEWET